MGASGLRAGLAAAVTAATLCAAGDRGEVVRHARELLASAERSREAADLDQAGELYAAAERAAGELGGPNLLLARAIDARADLARMGGRWEAAEAGYLRSAAMWEALLGELQPRLATTLHNLGAVRLEQGRLDEAEPVLRRALEIWQVALGEDSAEAANTRAALETLRVRRERR